MPLNDALRAGTLSRDVLLIQLQGASTPELESVVCALLKERAHRRRMDASIASAEAQKHFDEILKLEAAVRERHAAARRAATHDD